MVKFKSEMPEKVSLELGPMDAILMHDLLHAVRQNPQVNDLQHEAILRVRAEVNKTISPYVETENESKEEE